MRKHVLVLLCALLTLEVHSAVMTCAGLLASGASALAAWQLYKSCSSTKSTGRIKAPVFWGVAEDQGIRKTMEDAHTVHITPQYAFFGVYDGHGGRKMADFAAARLHKRFNDLFVLASKPQKDFIRECLRMSFLWTNKQFSQEHHLQDDGSCALVAVLRKDTLWVAHVGDSRAVLYADGTARALTRDHKPDRPDEAERIKQAGGKIMEQAGNKGVWYVLENAHQTKSADQAKAMLAVSRALGGRLFDGVVSRDPEINKVQLTGKEEFLILACDGVWDVLNNEEASEAVKEYLVEHPGNITGAAEYLKEMALLEGSTDNITVTVVDLAAARIRGLKQSK